MGNIDKRDVVRIQWLHTMSTKRNVTMLPDTTSSRSERLLIDMTESREPRPKAVEWQGFCEGQGAHGR